MPTKAELRRQWLIFLNGMIHAGYAGLGTATFSGLVLEPLHYFDVITVKTLWVSWAASIASGIVSGVWGYMKRSPIPDVFAVNADTGQFESDTKVLVADRDTGNLVSKLKEQV